MISALFTLFLFSENLMSSLTDFKDNFYLNIYLKGLVCNIGNRSSEGGAAASTKPAVFAKKDKFSYTSL